MAPNILITLTVASVSRENRGFSITELPSANDAKTIARCEKLLLGGALIEPSMAEGETLTLTSYTQHLSYFVIGMCFYDLPPESA